MEEVRPEAKRLRLFLLSPPLQHVTRSVDIGVGHHLTDFFSIPVEERRNQAICLAGFALGISPDALYTDPAGERGLNREAARENRAPDPPCPG